MLLVFNAWEDAIDFVLPAASDGAQWRLEVDTAQEPQEPGERFEAGSSYTVTARSMLVLVAA